MIEVHEAGGPEYLELHVKGQKSLKKVLLGKEPSLLSYEFPRIFSW
jgi:hypothetical protein